MMAGRDDRARRMELAGVAGMGVAVVLLAAVVATATAGRWADAPAARLVSVGAAPAARLVLVGAAPVRSPRAGSEAAPPMSRAAFHDAMRKLWEDHVTWTRLFIVSATGDLPDKAATTERLLQNQADIGNAVASFYGQAAGDALTALLRSHILVAADLVSAAKAGDATKVAETSQRWSANADSIARFLHGANPGQWPLATLQSAMKMHLEQTTSEVTDRLHGNYAAEVRDYDAIVAHILGMADVLSAGIMAQFPARFTGPALAATK